MAARIEWAMWANEQAVLSCPITFVGGLLALASLGMASFNRHSYYEAGIYAMVTSALIFLIEYPRGKRQKGRTLQRPYQHVLTPVISSLSFLGNYFVRFILYLILSAPCFMNLGSIMGGVAMLVAACIYLRAAIAGEKWVPCAREISTQKTLTRARPPSMAPPRLNSSSVNYAVDADDEDAYENAANIQA